MSKPAEDYIPHEIQKAAKAAKLSTPLWYAGRSNGHETHKPKHGFGKVVADKRADLGQTVDFSDPVPNAPKKTKR